jgi:hypothetical protein
MKKNKYIFIILIIIIIVCFFKKNKIKESFSNKNIDNEKILGFQICGVGNGHITQSQVIYKILIKNFKIPIVIIYGRNGGFDDYYKESKVIYKEIKCDEQGVNDMETKKVIKEVFNFKDSKIYEKIYGINNWLNFWIVDWFNYRTKQYAIASQLSLPQISVAGLIILSNLLSLSIPISIFFENNYSKYKFPSLIDDQKLDRNNVDKKLIVAYSVSGENFPTILNNIALNNPSYTFHYFRNYDKNLISAKNVIKHLPSRIEFKKYLSKSSAVFCTSGNELIQECVYNKIPVATIPCSEKQFEQKFNFRNYVTKYKWAEEMKPDINLELLLKKNMEKHSQYISESLENREKIITDLITKL